MPKLGIVKGEDGKFTIQSQGMAEGGPADTWIGVTEDKAFLACDTEDEARTFLQENGGGSLYFVVHYRRTDSEGIEEWAPKSYPRGKVDSAKTLAAMEKLQEAKTV